MTDQGICDKCGQRNGCKHVYQQMADYKGPSVLGKVLIAFVLPLLGFVVSLTIFQEVMAKLISSKRMASALSAAMAIGVTALIVAITRLVNRRFGKDRQN
jgi:nitrate reductase gamma subunit